MFNNGYPYLLAQTPGVPDTFITTTPNNPAYSPTPTFILTSNLDWATFECQIDDEGYFPCTTPYTSSPLTDGEHTVLVKATNIDGLTDQTPAVVNWTVNAVAVDTDSDSLTDVIENAGPNNGDANNDGTPDTLQPTVAGFVNPITHNYQVIVAGACDVFESIQTGSEASDPADSQYDYPTGLTEFRALCGGPGQVGSFSQYFYGVEGNDKFEMRKWSDSTYETMQGVTFSQEEIDGQTVLKVSYQITDGGQYDEDIEANAYIVDPAGIALPVNAAASMSTTLANTGESISQLYLLLIALIGFPTLILIRHRS